MVWSVPASVAGPYHSRLSSSSYGSRGSSPHGLCRVPLFITCPEAINHDLRVSQTGRGLYQIRPVICSGVVLGVAAAFEAWTDAMLTLIFRSRFESLVRNLAHFCPTPYEVQGG